MILYIWMGAITLLAGITFTACRALVQDHHFLIPAAPVTIFSGYLWTTLVVRFTDAFPLLFLRVVLHLDQEHVLVPAYWCIVLASIIGVIYFIHKLWEENSVWTLVFFVLQMLFMGIMTGLGLFIWFPSLSL